MIKRILIAVMCLGFSVNCIQAAMFFGGLDTKESPSVINYGWSGLKLGTLLGAAVGGVQAADQHERLDNSGEARRVTNGALYGLICGTVMGLGIGFYDLSQGQTGVGGIILRDMWMGGGLGLVVGAAVGGITYSKTEEGRHIGQSIAWGYIGGTIAGFAFGLVEGPQIASKPSPIRVVMMPDSEGLPSPYVLYHYRF